MPNTKTALNHFLMFNDQVEERLPDLLESEDFKPVKETMSQELKSLAVPKGFFEKMIVQLSELLNIDVRAILISAWSSSGELSKYADPAQYPPEEVVLVPMAEHTITSMHAPALKPSINQVSLGEIKFNINLELKMAGVILKIQDGKIKEVTIGSCAIKGAVRYSDFVILEKEGNFPELIGTIHLGEGIAIGETAESIHQALSELTQEGEQQTASENGMPAGADRAKI